MNAVREEHKEFACRDSEETDKIELIVYKQ